MNQRFLLSTMFASISLFSTAQYASQTYAITGNSNGDFSWRNIRQVDISSGKVVKDVFISGSSARLLDGTSGKQLSSAEAENISSNDYVAASAFDVRSNKLFYSTLHTGQLRWVDLSNKSGQLSIYARPQQFVSSADITDESINITRMCIGADGNGYALTNDANHLYRFTTDSKVVVTDLGNLVDAEANHGISVHNKCTSWGGDMVADAFGKLYLITANHIVFTIDINSRVATYLGTISGLPGTYTTNGAAVDDNGDIVVNSSLSKEGYYKVKLAGLFATKIENSDKTYSVSDLANGNLLLQKEADALRNTGGQAILPVASLNIGNGHIYPNPITNSVFNVSFDGLQTGKYLIKVTELSGKLIMTKSVNIGIPGQVEKVTLTPMLSQGMYFVKVESDDKRNAFMEKIIVN